MGNHFIKKYTNEDIEKQLKINEYSWLDGEYANACSKIIICDREGYKSQSAISSIMRGSQFKKFDKRNPFAKDNIILWMKNNYKYSIMEFKEYLGQCEKNIICNCEEHGEFIRSWNEIYCGSGCPLCANNICLTIEQAKENIYKRNPNIKILSNIYINSYEKLQCGCLKDGHTWESSYHNLYYHGCPECKRRKQINIYITEEERKIGRNYPEYRKFVKEVLERDNYTCQITFKESDRVTVHHIEGYNWCKDKRTDIDNGIVLNEDIHKLFHSIYGYGDNTKEQFEEFKIRYNNGEFNEG